MSFEDAQSLQNEPDPSPFKSFEHTTPSRAAPLKREFSLKREASSKIFQLSNVAAEWLTKITDPDRIKAKRNLVESWNSMYALNLATWLLGIFQAFLVILFATCVAQNSEVLASNPDSAMTGLTGYNMFIGVEIMMFVGFGYLMTFLKLYSLGAVGFCMMIIAVGLQWYVFVEAFWTQVWTDDDQWHPVDFNIYSLLNALYGISAVLISFGALIGKVSPIQLLIMTIIELVLHAFNYKILLSGVLKVADMGGTYIDHMFGAYFGLAVAYVLGSPKNMPQMGNTQDIFSLIGTVFLWVYWPSFVAGAAEPNSPQQQRAIVNTILALAASTVGAFWCSSFLSKDARYRPVDIQNATLAGGVAIGTVANIRLAPFGAVMIGLFSGLWSVFGYNIIMPYMEEMGVHDTCGIHNLHAMPSVIGALASVLLAAYAQQSSEDAISYYGATAPTQWWHQLVGIILCMSFAIFTGFVTGHILKIFGKDEEHMVESDLAFNDNCYWEVADDYGRSFYKELASLVTDDPKHGLMESSKMTAMQQSIAAMDAHGGRTAVHEHQDALLNSSIHEDSSHDRHPVLYKLLDNSLNGKKTKAKRIANKKKTNNEEEGKAGEEAVAAEV